VTKFYLDTSAHLERWTGSRDKRAEIAVLLQGETHATSSHARREWKRVAEIAAAEVLNAFERSDDLSDVLVHISQLSFREPKQALRVLSLFVRDQSVLDRRVLRKARLFLRSGSRQRFEESVEVRDGSECQLAQNQVYRHSSGSLRLEWRCRKYEDICEQEAFIAARDPQYRAVGKALRDNSPTDRKGDIAMGAAAVAAPDSPRDAKGKVCYSVLGDVSIAMECGDAEEILTTDRSFDTIGPALGIKVRRLQPSP
jgi:hypothetical protein